MDWKTPISSHPPQPRSVARANSEPSRSADGYGDPTLIVESSSLPLNQEVSLAELRKLQVLPMDWEIASLSPSSPRVAPFNQEFPLEEFGKLQGLPMDWETPT